MSLANSQHSPYTQDFRSSDGLYALVKERYPDVVLKGRDLFDASLFRDATSTAVFYTFISQLKRSIDAAEPSPTHHFIKTLDTKKKLLRSYTQNIDGLEARVGLLGSSCHEAKSNGKGKTKIRTKDVRNVQLHGDIHRVRCVACSADYPCTEEYLAVFGKGNAPDCPECLSRCESNGKYIMFDFADLLGICLAEARLARSARPIRVGNLRPGIVLYDETHPLGDDIGTIHTADLGRKPDLLIIMGTSLKVHGLKKLVKDFARAIHASTSSNASSSKKPFKVIFVNKTAPGAEWSDIIDYHIQGETDRWTNKVLEDWKKMRPSDWEIQQTLDSENSMDAFKITKSMASSLKNGVKPKSGQENIPILPTETSGKPSTDKPKPTPLSPSKRQQKSSHYDDLESSPSKRRSASSGRQNVMPKEERRMLFAETTNKAVNIVDTGNSSKMDISLCELTVEEVDLDVGPRHLRFPIKGSARKTTGETSAMDISIRELSMIDIIPEGVETRAKASKVKGPAKPRTRAVRGRRAVQKRETVAWKHWAVVLYHYALLQAYVLLYLFISSLVAFDIVVYSIIHPIYIHKSGVVDGLESNYAKPEKKKDGGDRYESCENIQSLISD